MSKFVTLHGFGGCDPVLQNKTVIPSLNEQNIIADNEYDGLGAVTVTGDANLKASNIKKDVNIFGVAGDYTDLNFEVVGGTSAPASPKENTIWVNTDVAITSYSFKTTKPGDSEGRVWILTDSYSNVSFDALDKNWLWVYPISAKQYINGAWVNKTAKTYQSGEWKDWIVYLFNNGDQCADLTGGWTQSGFYYNDGSSSNPHGGTSTIDDVITVVGVATSGTAGKTAGVMTSYAVDLTNFSKLWIRGVMTGSIHGPGLYISKNTSGNTYTSGAVAASVYIDSTSITEEFLDVSSYSGEYYIHIIGIRARGGKVYAIWME